MTTKDAYIRCCTAWACCPSLLKLFIIFIISNIIGDVMSFPIAHTFWNYVGFEGFFQKEGH